MHRAFCKVCGLGLNGTDVHAVSGMGLKDGPYCSRHCPFCQDQRSQQSTAARAAEEQPNTKKG